MIESVLTPNPSDERRSYPTPNRFTYLHCWNHFKDLASASKKDTSPYMKGKMQLSKWPCTMFTADVDEMSYPRICKRRWIWNELSNAMCDTTSHASYQVNMASANNFFTWMHGRTFYGGNFTHNLEWLCLGRFIESDCFIGQGIYINHRYIDWITLNWITLKHCQNVLWKLGQCHGF